MKRDSYKEEKAALAWLEKNPLPEPPKNHRLIPEDERVDPETLPLFEERELAHGLMQDSTLWAYRFQSTKTAFARKHTLNLLLRFHV